MGHPMPDAPCGVPGGGGGNRRTGGGGAGSIIKGIISQIESKAESFVCSATSSLQAWAEASQGTIAVGGGASGTFAPFWGFSASVSLQLAADPNGHIGPALSYSWNAGMPFALGISAVAGVSATNSDAQTLGQFASPATTQITQSAGVADAQVSLSGSPSSTSFNVLAGDGWGFKYSSATETGGTYVPFSINCQPQ